MPSTSTSLGPLGHKGIDDIYWETQDKMDKEYLDIIGENTIDSRQLYERFLMMSDLAPADLTDEGQMPFEDEPYPVGSMDVYSQRATRMVQWDDEIEWMDQYDFLEKERMPMIADAFMNRKEMVMASMNTLGFAAGLNFIVPTEPLYASNHALAGAGSNLLVSNIPLCPLALGQIRVGIRTQVTVRGNPIKWDGNMVVTASPLNAVYARVIMETEKLPGTMDNDKNVYRDRTTIRINDYYPATSTAYFARTEKGHGLAMINQMPFKSKMISMNAAWINTITCREKYAYLAKKWQRTYACAGS